MYEIKTSNYIKPKKILVDGQEWTMNLPGAGDELALSQALRRLKHLDTKIAANTANEADYDRYDELENKVYSMFFSIFKDGTEDNEQVKKWVSSTPLEIVKIAIEDIKNQAQEKKQDGQATT